MLLHKIEPLHLQQSASTRICNTAKDPVSPTKEYAAHLRGGRLPAAGGRRAAGSCAKLRGAAAGRTARRTDGRSRGSAARRGRAGADGRQRGGGSSGSIGSSAAAERPRLSPRPRPGEASGVSPEIKALQQTRRLLANARERTRVHTISAAFEALRKQVPCYSYGQKLSKLAILRIACNYILSLARLADLDYSADHSNMSFSECVEQCTRTLQAEGRSKKRKE
ncbi:protein atonal homolog 8 [Onychostruthus taczanowskii]|uniref:protein atonal homolog 8 n=1 Tax=Onychostruthus taczanowskii TaxID=356909 RepID=UPI001B805B93|nr:protein atonal homolog 8 [Onychostruthus taczanowskii]